MPTGLAIEQGKPQRDHHRLLDRLARCGGHVLRQGQPRRITFVDHPRSDLRRAGLTVPQAELGQIDFGTLLDRLDEILAGRGLAIVAVKIEVGPLAKALWPDQRPHHPDDLGALVIDRGGVEVGDLLIGIRTDRVGQRAAVFRELGRAKHAHILDPLDRLTAHVLAEQLVAQHGKAFLQAQLEPVAAGNAVARPVVEVFVGNHTLDPVVVHVGGGFGIGEDIAGVEDVEPLVLHRPHVEV